MSQGETLRFLALEDGSLRKGDCLRIKLHEGGSAILAFASSEVALHYARFHNIQPKFLDRTRLAADVDSSLPLLIFRSETEIDLAYRDPKEYDFAKHIEPWPAGKNHAT